MAKYIFNLIQAANGAILKDTYGFPVNDPYLRIKEGDSESSGENSPFTPLISEYFNNFILDEAWGDGDNLREFKVTVDIKRIK